MEARIIVASNRDLAQLVRQGRFRQDLYYRLKVVDLHPPPLRERKEDIPLLVRHFLALFNRELKKGVTDAAPDVLDAFLRRDWPGNVRELKHVLECACVNCARSVITADDIPHAPPLEIQRPAPAAGDPKSAEAARILDVLQSTRWDKSLTAKALGISRQTLYRKIRDLEIKDDCNGCDSL